MAGKGMTPKKGYNAKNWNKNFDKIDWSDKPEVTIRLDKNTVGYFPTEEKQKQNGNTISNPTERRDKTTT